MEKIRLGRTNLEVTKMGLGGIPLSTVMGGRDEETIEKVINAALDRGINFIDTSRVYMDSEANIGKVMKRRRSECIIASKSHRRGYDEVLEDLEESLKNLQTDKIEIYQIHELGPDEVEQVMRKDGALDAFKKAKSEGMIDFIGLTSHHTQVMVDLIKTGEFDTVMFPFNVIEREPEAELVGLCRSLNVGTIVMKALAGGVIRNIENSHRFLCGYPLDNILVGCATVDELNENIDFMEKAKPLSAEELKKFEEEVAPLGKDFCRRCNYCMPCPNDIIIPVMIHLTWQRMKGQGYEKMSSHEKERAKNLSIWWQACTECGECEQKCPYDLPTIERKRELMEKFS